MKKFKLELTYKEAEALFCYLQMAQIRISEDTRKYAIAAEKVRFKLEDYVEDNYNE